MTCFHLWLYAGGMASPPRLIDAHAHRRHRDRAAAGYESHAFLKRTIAAHMTERLDTVRRDFALVADIGCHDGSLARALMAHAKIGKVVACDPSPAMAERARANGVDAAACDYHDLPFAPAGLDAVFSALSLHWAEDLPGVLTRMARLLKPDGLMMVSLYGGGTLREFRAALTQAEHEITGGMSPRVMPMADIRDLGGLPQRAGLALPVADSERFRITWPDIFALMRDLRGMGEASALAGRRRVFTPKSVFTRADEIMRRRAEEQNAIAETFEIITLTAWAPHANQQKPLMPGSAQTPLADALGNNGG